MAEIAARADAKTGAIHAHAADAAPQELVDILINLMAIAVC
jgi:hypothetical protein